MSSEFVLRGDVNASRLEVGHDGIRGLDWHEIIVGYIPCLVGFTRSALKPSSLSRPLDKGLASIKAIFARLFLCFSHYAAHVQ